jgi:hypothetical protein
VEVVRGAINAFQRGEFEAALSAFSEEVVSDPAAPEGEGFIVMLARIDDYPPDRAAAARAEWDREQARLSGRPSESPENSADRTARTAG